MQIKKMRKKRILVTNEERDSYSINESLLQSYRQIFIESEAFLLTAGVLAFEKFFPIFLAVVLCSLTTIIIWFPVVFSRHLIVDYYKFAVGKKTIFSEDDYVHPRKRKHTTRKEINKIVGGKLAKEGNLRKTRRKIDLYIPIAFLIIWLTLIFYYKAPENITTALSVQITKGDCFFQILSMYIEEVVSVLIK